MSTDPIQDLEIKVAFLEHHVEELDSLLRAAIDRLERSEARLGEAIERVAAVQASLRDAPDHERPPHHLPDPLDPSS